ncbi:hypothetical protein [Bradyrhizobium sp. CCGE-LA001]|uniref:hypothetical protein n=1 Tax=Bradyrhizobium sp. CCGE-LA001 TaxID=1223566 RepID=UPI0011982042|nr:hypothetical protein [Bradyrhizobium sp. CCGE-LA001]
MIRLYQVHSAGDRFGILRKQFVGMPRAITYTTRDQMGTVRAIVSASAVCPGAGTTRGDRRPAEPDWAAVHREFMREVVTLSTRGRNISRPNLTVAGKVLLGLPCPEGRFSVRMRRIQCSVGCATTSSTVSLMSALQSAI